MREIVGFIVAFALLLAMFKLLKHEPLCITYDNNTHCISLSSK